MNYKGKAVEGCELKLNRLTADKKQRKVRWSPLSETGQKGDSMFAATIIRTALFKKKKKTILFTLFRTEFFQYPDALKKLGWGCIFKEDSQQNHLPSLSAIITVSTLQTGSLILALTLSQYQQCAFNLFCNF